MSAPRANEWLSLAISDIADFGSGELISIARLHARSASYPIPVYGGNGIAGYTSLAMVDQPTVILGRVGQKCGVVHRNDGQAWVTDNALYARRFKRPLDVRFLAFALEAAQLNNIKNRNDLPLITQSILNDVKIAWSDSLDEQRQIAGIMTDIDDLIASLERMISKKQAIKRGMMQQLLTGEQRLAGFTGPWKVARFEELALPVRDRTDPRATAPNTPLIEMEHIEPRSGRILGSGAAGDALSLKTVFQPGDVLFGRLRAYLRKYWLADSTGICSTEIWALRAKPMACAGYVRYIVETDRFIEVASGGYGTHMPRADWGTLRGLCFDIPPLDEQKMIAAALTDIDDEIGALSSRLAKANAVKQGMMQELLSGRTRLAA